jgi:hypothetical protein
MGYKPVVYKINSDNLIEIMYQFVENWYEIVTNKDIEKINFGNIFKINISNKINDLLNFLVGLNHSTVYGKKLYMYSGFNYIFKRWSKSQEIFFDKKLDILFLFQEGFQNFYFGIKRENLLEDNPSVYKIIKNKDAFEYYRDLNIIDFIVYHICTNAAKIGIKSYSLFIENGMETQLKQFEKLFEHKKQFSCFTIYEKDNVIASIDNGTDIMKPIVTVNKWEKKDKEITNKIIDIFNWDGWSDNNGRYKL